MLYRLTISLITPLHIGSGNILLRDYDFKTVGNRTWVLDQEAILAEEFDRGDQSNWQWLAKKPGELVRDAELREGSPFVRYALEGTTSVDQVREQIKDVHGRCYLPGSSLKGALRSVLMSYAVRSGHFKPDVQALGDRPEWAGQPWERAVFGRDPNHDLLRALIVADSEPVSPSPSPLTLLNAQVFTGGKPGSPIVVEAVRADVVFKSTLRVDDYLLGDVARQLGFADRRKWVTDLAAIARQVNGARIKQELEWYDRKGGFPTARSIYSTLDKARLDANAFVLQLGWGAGWTAKSVGVWLSQKQTSWSCADAFDWASRRRPAVTGAPTPAGRSQTAAACVPGAIRVRSSRIVPLGWVLVEMTEVV
jgi:CRISPR-associated protein Csm5